jgi:hypothetical protein
VQVTRLREHGCSLASPAAARSATGHQIAMGCPRRPTPGLQPRVLARRSTPSSRSPDYSAACSAWLISIPFSLALALAAAPRNGDAADAPSQLINLIGANNRKPCSQYPGQADREQVRPSTDVADCGRGQSEPADLWVPTVGYERPLMPKVVHLLAAHNDAEQRIAVHAAFAPELGWEVISAARSMLNRKSVGHWARRQHPAERQRSRVLGGRGGGVMLSAAGCVRRRRGG